MAVDLASLKTEIRARLGGGVKAPPGSAIVQVELTDEQFDYAVKATRRWFNSKKGVTAFRPLTILDGVPTYQLDKDVVNVVDVYFAVPSDVAAFFTLGFFDVIPFGAQPTGGPVSSLSNYSSFAQILDFNEKRKRIFSVEPEWYYDEQTQTLSVAVRKGSNTGTALIHVRTEMKDPKVLKGKDELLFADYLMAECKEIVGRIRSKYDSMPAAGGNVTLDGKDLIAESKEEKERLNTEIFASQGPDMPIAG